MHFSSGACAGLAGSLVWAGTFTQLGVGGPSDGPRGVTWPFSTCFSSTSKIIWGSRAGSTEEQGESGCSGQACSRLGCGNSLTSRGPSEVAWPRPVSGGRTPPAQLQSTGRGGEQRFSCHQFTPGGVTGTEARLNEPRGAFPLHPQSQQPPFPELPPCAKHRVRGAAQQPCRQAFLFHR